MKILVEIICFFFISGLQAFHSKLIKNKRHINIFYRILNNIKKGYECKNYNKIFKTRDIDWQFQEK